MAYLNGVCMISRKSYSTFFKIALPWATINMCSTVGPDGAFYDSNENGILTKNPSENDRNYEKREGNTR